MLVLQPKIFALGNLFLWHLAGYVASILPGSSRSNLGFVRVGRLAIDDLFVNPKYMEDKGLVIPESLKGGGKQQREIQTWKFLKNPR